MVAQCKENSDQDHKYQRTEKVLHGSRWQIFVGATNTRCLVVKDFLHIDSIAFV